MPLSGAICVAARPRGFTMVTRSVTPSPSPPLSLTSARAKTVPGPHWRLHTSTAFGEIPRSSGTMACGSPPGLACRSPPAGWRLHLDQGLGRNHATSQYDDERDHTNTDELFRAHAWPPF